MNRFPHNVSRIAAFLILNAILFVSDSLAQTPSITGFSPVDVGSTHEYVYSDDIILAQPHWIVSLGEVVDYWTIGIEHHVTINWTSAGSGSVTFKDGTITISSKSVTINDVLQSPTATDVFRCGSGTLVLNGQLANGANPNNTLRWYATENFGAPLFTGMSYTTPILTASKTYYVAAYDPATGSHSFPRVPVLAEVRSIPTVAVSVSAQTICSGTPMTAISISNPNSIPGTAFSWTMSAPNITGGSAGSTSTIQQTLSHTQFTDQVATYTAKAINNGCESVTTATVTLKPRPALSSTLTPVAVCSQSLFGYTPTSGVAGTTFSWSRPAVSGISETTANGTNGISESLTNTTNTSRTVPYTYTLSANGCTNTNVVNATIKPKPTIALSSVAQTLCSGVIMSTVNISNPNSVSGTTYSWSVSAPNITGASSGSGSMIGQTLTHNQTTSQSAAYSVTGTANGCASLISLHTVTVKPTPTVALSSPTQSICTGAAMTSVSISNPNNIPGTTFSWTVVAVADVVGESSGSGTIISQNLSQATNVNQQATYSVKASINGCESSSAQHVVTIKPKPTVAVSSSGQSICSGVAMGVVTISNPNAVAGTTFNWTVSAPNITGASAGSGSSIAQTLMQTSNVNQIATYAATATANGCIGSATTHLVTVKPQPTLSLTPSSSTICSGGTTAIVLGNPNNVSGTSYNWTVSAPSITGASNGSGASIAQTLTQVTTSAKTATYTISATANGCSSITSNATVNVNGVVDPGTIGSAQTICTGTVPATLTNVASPTGGNGSFAYQWEKSTNNETWTNATGISNANTYSPPPLTVPTYFRRLATSCNSVMPTASVLIGVDALSVGGTLGPNVEAYSVSSGTLTLIGQTGAVLKWQQKIGSGNWTDIALTSTSRPFTDVSTTMQFQVQVQNGFCPSAWSSVATIKVYPIPTFAIDGPDEIAPGDSSRLVASSDLYSYEWMRANSIIDGQNNDTLIVKIPGSYRIKVKASATSPELVIGPLLIYNTLRTQDLNIITTTVYTKPGVSASTSNFDLDASEFQMTRNYIDGLGRPLQSVVLGGAGNGADLVQVIRYDVYGREPRKYLPYVTSGRSGIYRETGVADQLAFYTNPTSDEIPQSTKPFAESIFEPSPLNRVLKQGHPGESWQPDESPFVTPTDHGIKMMAGHNEVNEVRLWEVGHPIATESFGEIWSSDFYAPHELSRTKTKDENNNTVIEYADKQGRVILRRIQAVSGGSVVDDVNYASTYYIYDDFGRLACVIPPEATKLLNTEYFAPGNSSANREQFLGTWAFRYKYDTRGRMTVKKVPGAAPVYMVYDNRDRLVLTQDGRQRQTNEWLFTKYDRLNRPILTGIYSPDSILAINKMQQRVDRFYIQNGAWHESYSGSSTHAYTNNSFPVVAATNDYLTVTYYDNYDFKSAWGANFNYKDENLSASVNGQPYSQPDSEWLRIRGQVTGTKTKVLDGTHAWIRSINYYDDNYRLIQNITDNNVGGLDWNSTLYDFAGKVQRVRSSHNGRLISRRFVYDDGGRVTKVYHRIENGNEVILTANKYNALGQPVTKSLHSTNNGATYQQKIDQRYNIRGWLTRINHADLNNNLDGGPRDYFGMELAYHDNIGVGTTIPQYNGNISAAKWSTSFGPGSGSGAFGLPAPTQSAYIFEYDPLSRLLSAEHQQKTAAWAPSNSYDEKNITYDLNGNIMTLDRKGKNASLMDDLSYTYTGNQLTKVLDHGNDADGFTDGLDAGTEYTYDPNGNMISDGNKLITSITYNHLNLPAVVSKNTGEYVKYIYDANGRKLKQEVYDANNVLKKESDYAGEYFYENDTLKFINHEEGRVVMAGSPEYQYHLKDHLGNIRLTFTSKKDAQTDIATFESANATAQQAEFLRNQHVRKVQSVLFDRTNGLATGYAQRLNGTANEAYGLAKSLSVMPGDTIRVEVYAKYVDRNSANWLPAFTNLMGQIASGNSAVVYEGSSYTSSTTSFGYAGLQNTSGSMGVGPRAFLNWLVFDRDFNLVTAGFKRISDQPREYGQDVEHERLDGVIPVGRAGYVYIYLSNEESVNPVEVYFDDFKVKHVKSPVVQMEDYYPFGLTYNSYSRENSIEQKYQYNGKELQDELNLGWLDYGARMYMSEIGRWGTLDPKADIMPALSPYNHSLNNPIRYVDPDGEFPIDVTLRSFAPFNTFGMGFKGDGSNRGFSTDPGARSKLHATARIETDDMSLVSKRGYDVESSGGFGLWSAISDTRVDAAMNGNTLSMQAEAGNDAAIPFMDTDIGDAMNMNIDNNASLSFNLSDGADGNQILNIAGQITGDHFPAGEAFATDAAGNSVFLGVSNTGPVANSSLAPYIMLAGKGDQTMSTVNVSIVVNSKGEFIGVMNNEGKMISINEYNKPFTERKPVEENNGGHVVK